MFGITFFLWRVFELNFSFTFALTILPQARWITVYRMTLDFEYNKKTNCCEPMFPIIPTDDIHDVSFAGTPYNLLVVLGPTASGKTKLAAHLAYALGGEVVCADSRQVYKGMDVGTGKDYDDYLVDNVRVPHHLMDVAEAGYKYNVYEYQADFYKTFIDLGRRNRFPVMCGGSGLYIESVLSQYQLINVPSNPELRERLAGKSLDELAQILATYRQLHNQTDTDTVPRAIRSIEIADFNANHSMPDISLPKVRPLIVGVHIDTPSRRDRITQRLKERLDGGMVDEVRRLLDNGVTADDLIYYGLEYKYLTQYVTGVLSYDDMFEGLNIAIHQFAKRQMTWFRRMERNGFDIRWVDVFEPMGQRVERIVGWLRE